jgi:hypothetical protein
MNIICLDMFGRCGALVLAAVVCLCGVSCTEETGQGLPPPELREQAYAQADGNRDRRSPEREAAGAARQDDEGCASEEKPTRGKCFGSPNGGVVVLVVSRGKDMLVYDISNPDRIMRLERLPQPSDGERESVYHTLKDTLEGERALPRP